MGYRDINRIAARRASDRRGRARHQGSFPTEPGLQSLYDEHAPHLRRDQDLGLNGNSQVLPGPHFDWSRGRGCECRNARKINVARRLAIKVVSRRTRGGPREDDPTLVEDVGRLAHPYDCAPVVGDEYAGGTT